MIQILVVEDEKAISDLIAFNLRNAGYEITCAYDGETACNYIEDYAYDLILLDIMLPKLNGYEIFEYIKPMNIPVIFITAKNTLDDRVKGLNLGAEDYIVKPFEVVELLARVNVVLRRYQKAESTVSFMDISMNLKTQSVTKNGVSIDLTQKECAILEMFLKNPGITLFRDRIYEIVWECEYEGDSRTVDLHVHRLRKKTGLNDHIKTIYGVGYRLEE